MKIDINDYKINENGCHLWLKAKTSAGYGQKRFNKKLIYVHRQIFQDHHKKNIADLVIRHKCDNPSCINVDHLEYGTQKDNMLDCKTRNRNKAWLKTHCKNGHEINEQNYYYKNGKAHTCRLCRNS